MVADARRVAVARKRQMRRRRFDSVSAYTISELKINILIKMINKTPDGEERIKMKKKRERVSEYSLKLRYLNVVW